jgi:hypothetical protein
MHELNDKFGTKHKHVSKMLEGISRGLKEIISLTGEEIRCVYDNGHKVFVFSWIKDVEAIESKCIIPYSRVGEFIDWVIIHSKTKIKDLDKYSAKIKQMILDNTLDDLESLYRGMLLYKYGYTSDEIDMLKTISGKYKDFSRKKEQKSLFGD